MDHMQFVALIVVFVQIVEYIISFRSIYDADNHLLMSMLDYESDFYIDAQIAICNAALHDYRVTINLLIDNDDLWWYVKPRSLTWFADFRMTEYDISRWIDLFRMSKESFTRRTTGINDYATTTKTAHND